MKSLSRLFLFLLLSGLSAFAQTSASDGFRSLQADAGKVIGEIRSFQGLNGQPTPVMAGLPNLVRQYKELRVDQVRTHDFMGPTEIDSKFEYTNKDLADLIPDSAERAGVVKAGNAAILFPDANAIRKSRKATILVRLIKCWPRFVQAGRRFITAWDAVGAPI